MTTALVRLPKQLEVLFGEDRLDGPHKFLYRVDGCSFEPYLFCAAYKVVRETAKGVWIDVYGKERFVLSGAIKRYAYPTKDEALHSFIKRKERQMKILQAQLERIATQLAATKEYL